MTKYIAGLQFPRDNERIVEEGADILALNNGATWTLQPRTQRGYIWLQSQVGADGREIELEASLAQEFCMRAMEQGLIVTAKL